VPGFNNKQNEYVALGEVAAAAYEVFEPFNGSTKHFLAVFIIRNKVKCATSFTLKSYNTTLNFQAIIARFNFKYAAKTPIRVLLQKLGTLRQGELSLLDYCGNVEMTLTLLTNKTIKTH